jgi:hypothetical protein
VGGCRRVGSVNGTARAARVTVASSAVERLSGDGEQSVR